MLNYSGIKFWHLPRNIDMVYCDRFYKIDHVEIVANRSSVLGFYRLLRLHVDEKESDWVVVYYDIVSNTIESGGDIAIDIKYQPKFDALVDKAMQKLINVA